MLRLTLEPVSREMIEEVLVVFQSIWEAAIAPVMAVLGERLTIANLRMLQGRESMTGDGAILSRLDAGGLRA